MTLIRLIVQLLPALGSILPRGGVPARELIRGLLVQLVLGLVAVVLLATAAGFAIAACYMSLAMSQGPAVAATIVALGLLVIAGLLAGLAAALSQRRSHRAALARLEAQQAAVAPVNQLMLQIAANPLSSLLIAAVAGLAAGWLDRKD